MSEYVYVNISDNHFKVWGYDGFCSDKTNEHEIITYWGRMGVSMQHLRKNRKHIDNFHDARKYIHNKIDEKIWKGYKGIPTGMYFQMIQSPRGIAALIEKVKHLEENHLTLNRVMKKKKQKAKVAKCPKCNGTGKDFIYQCWPCRGTGYIAIRYKK